MMCRYCECPNCGRKYNVAAVLVNSEALCRRCNRWFKPSLDGPLVFRPDLPCVPEIDDLVNRN